MAISAKKEVMISKRCYVRGLIDNYIRSARDETSDVNLSAGQKKRSGEQEGRVDVYGRIREKMRQKIEIRIHECHSQWKKRPSPISMHRGTSRWLHERLMMSEKDVVDEKNGCDDMRSKRNETKRTVQAK